jgi:hypothetical protein
MSPRKNSHAVALGRLGGRAKSEKKAAAVRANGRLGGGQRIYPAGITGAQRYHLRNIAAQGGRTVTEAQARAVADVHELSKKKEPRS